MRVTNQMIGNALRNNIQNNLTTLSRTQEQLSTGKTILRPSDSPTDISQLMAVKAQQKINEQYTQNIDDGLAYLYTADTALGTVGDLLHTANELAVQGANGTLDTPDMQALGEQIDKLIDHMVDLGNTTAAGKYIFAGRTNHRPPFERNGDTITYRGDLLRIEREIANGSNHPVDAPGVVIDTESKPGVFGFIAGEDKVNGAEVSGGVFETLVELKNRLHSGDHAGVSDYIDDIQSQLDNVLERRVAVGARTRHFESVKEQMLDQDIRLSEVIQNIQSADIADLTIDLSQQQLTYQTSLAVGANILQTSLLNFLK